MNAHARNGRQKLTRPFQFVQALENRHLFAAAPTGYVDIANTTTIAGWALAPDVPGTPLTIRIDMDSQTIGTTTANINRPDLVPIYNSADHGFSFTLPPHFVGLHRFDIYALDPATSAPTLLESRLVNTNSPPTGWIDVADATTFKGWAFDKDAGAAGVYVRYVIDNNAPQLTVASLNRSDLTAHVGSPDHGFSVNLPALTPGPHQISAWAIDPITWAPTPLGTRTIHVAAPAGNPLPHGVVETITPTGVTGWAYDPSTPAASIKIRIDIDNMPFAPFSANLSRPELAKNLGSANHGFSRNLKLSPGSHTIAVYAIDTTSGTAVLLKSQVVNSPLPRGSIDGFTATRAQVRAFLTRFDGGPPYVRLDIDNIPGVVRNVQDIGPSVNSVQTGPNYNLNIPLPKLLPGKHIARLYVIDYLTFNAILLDTATFITL